MDRRMAQNNFRINACKILKREFPGAIVGVMPDCYSKEVAADVLMGKEDYKKTNYLKYLKSCVVAIADDGLKDTPGWKIGEYVLANKAIISTPINVVVEGFEEGRNYLSTKSRSDFKILPELIYQLMKNNRYMRLIEENKKWYFQYLEPVRYIERILSGCK
jgi:hypothetical protein